VSTRRKPNSGRPLGKPDRSPITHLDQLLSHQIRGTGACPDCDANVKIVQLEPLVHSIEVHHDATCPVYRGMAHR